MVVDPPLAPPCPPSPIVIVNSSEDWLEWLSTRTCLKPPLEPPVSLPRPPPPPPIAKTERLYPSGIVTLNVDDSSMIADLTPGQVTDCSNFSQKYHYHVCEV